MRKSPEIGFLLIQSGDISGRSVQTDRPYGLSVRTVRTERIRTEGDLLTAFKHELLDKDMKNPNLCPWDHAPVKERRILCQTSGGALAPERRLHREALKIQ